MTATFVPSALWLKAEERLDGLLKSEEELMSFEVSSGVLRIFFVLSGVIYTSIYMDDSIVLNLHAPLPPYRVTPLFYGIFHIFLWHG